MPCLYNVYRISCLFCVDSQSKLSLQKNAVHECISPRENSLRQTGSRNLERSQKYRVIFRYYFEIPVRHSEINLNSPSLKNRSIVPFEGQIQSSRAAFIIKIK